VAEDKAIFAALRLPHVLAALTPEGRTVVEAHTMPSFPVEPGTFELDGVRRDLRDALLVERDARGALLVRRASGGEALTVEPGSLLEEALRQPGVVVVGDTSTDPRAVALQAFAPGEAMLLVPLEQRGGPRGLLAVRDAPTRRFDDDEVALATAAEEEAGIALAIRAQTQVGGRPVGRRRLTGRRAHRRAAR
jgi:GAF domain-containing protein